MRSCQCPDKTSIEEPWWPIRKENLALLLEIFPRDQSSGQTGKE
jgi:hypothetical protein